jgi:hypothetical protein
MNKNQKEAGDKTHGPIVHRKETENCSLFKILEIHQHVIHFKQQRT